MKNDRCDIVVKMIDVLISCENIDQFTNTSQWIRKVSQTDYECSFILEQKILIDFLNKKALALH